MENGKNEKNDDSVEDSIEIQKYDELMMKTFNLEDQAAHYNKIPILDVINDYLKNNDDMKMTNTLEIASGFGQHAQYFCQNLKQIETYQTSEYDVTRLPAIFQINKYNRKALKPIKLDVTSDEDWKQLKDNNFDFVIVTNLCHISPIECTDKMFEGVSKKIKQNSYFFIYGPFTVDFKPTTKSNEDFDIYLKGINSSYGLRDVLYMEELGLRNKLKLIDRVSMPENNFILVFKRI